MTQIITLNIDFAQYSLEVAEAEVVKTAFVPIIESVQTLDTLFFDIIGKEITPELSKEAGDLRRKLVKERTGTANIHKQQKSYYLNGGRMVDGLKNKITECIESAETQLETIENHYVNIEKALIAKLHEDRKNTLVQFDYIDTGLSFGAMPETDWEHYFLGVKAKYEQTKLEEENERKRIEAERLEQIRIREENAKLLKEAAEKNALIEKAGQEAIAKQKELESSQKQVEKAKEEIKAVEQKIEIAKKTIPELITKIESYNFICEAGNLKMCVSWQELKSLI